MSDMRRREFIVLVGGAACAWPLAARAQQATMPVVGFLNQESEEMVSHLVTGFRKGLSETGFAENQNVAIENLARVDAGLTIEVEVIHPVAHQAVSHRDLAAIVNCRKFVACRECRELCAPAVEESISACQSRHFALRKTASLFDHLAGDQFGRCRM